MRLRFLMLLPMMVSGTALADSAAAPNQPPVDNGPNTPAANNAYQNGGVILQGAPGAPPPSPQATPQGQTPANAVQPKP